VLLIEHSSPDLLHRSASIDFPDLPVQTDGSSDHGRFPTERIIRRHTATEDHIRQPQEQSHANLRRRKSTSDISRQKMIFPVLRKAATLMFTPEKTISKPPNTWRSIRAIILSSCTGTLLCCLWIVLIFTCVGFNVLLVFIPISVCHFRISLYHP
jgi:hypothetical protein